MLVLYMVLNLVDFHIFQSKIDMYSFDKIIYFNKIVYKF
jgi:hypothetical protein